MAPGKTISEADSSVRLGPAVVYARVSSKDQEREGFSIPAQLGLLREYAARRGQAVAHEFVDVETAKRAGRPGFSQMLLFLRGNPDCRTLLVEKTDRLYRNLKDWVTVDQGLAPARQGQLLDRAARPSTERSVR